MFFGKKNIEGIKEVIKNNDAYQTIREEIANTISHGLGAILSIIGTFVLIYQSAIRGTVWHIVSCSIYGGSLITLYTTSTFYHVISHPRAKSVLRMLDHISVFVLIAGSYMPFSLVVLKSPTCWIIFGLQCFFCVLGITLKIIFNTRLEAFFAVLYIAMGWMAIFAVNQLIDHMSFTGFMWILVGGLCYTIGFIFYAVDVKYYYAHTIWHIFVLLGSICHFFTVLVYVIWL